MKKFSFNFKNIIFKQTEEGIFVGDSLFLSGFIEGITPCYHFFSYVDYKESYKIELINKDSLFPDTPLVLYYDKEQPQNFFKQLKSKGLNPNSIICDRDTIWDTIITSTETGLLSKSPLLSSEHCGWIRFKDKLFYMTSEFAISMDGLISEYRSNNQNAYILYDKSMEPSVAFQETMKLVTLNFREIMPIFITQILSLSIPIINEKNLYNIPGLFLSGPTSTGKTEIALEIGTLFGNPISKDLRNFMILQKSIREFEHRQKGFSDTTFILDDARLPKSQTIRQSTVDVIERCGRAAFDKSDTRITPIITGEPKVFNGHLDSLKSRFIEIFFSSNESQMDNRKKLIQTVRENPKPLRTCLVHFIEFLCRNIDSSAIDDVIRNAQKDFYSEFKKDPFRNQDNLLMHYIGLSLFLYYGQIECNLNQYDKKQYEEQYKQALVNIQMYNEIQTVDGQVNVFIFLLYNSIKNKRFNVSIPTSEAYEFFYPSIDTSHITIIWAERKHKKFTYGYRASIDMEFGFSGTYIKKIKYIPGCEKKSKGSSVLLLNRELLFRAIQKENRIFASQYNYKPLYLSEQSLLHHLAEREILYTENRSGKDKGLKNYCFKYPHMYKKKILLQSVICLNTDIPVMDELVKCINELSNTEPLEDPFADSPRFEYSKKEIETFFQDIRPLL